MDHALWRADRRLGRHFVQDRSRCRIKKASGRDAGVGDRRAGRCVMNYQWNWALLLKEPYAGWLLIGLGWTVALSIAGWLIALPLGTTIGIARTSSSRWVLGLSGFYVSVFRNIPLLLQMFVCFFVVPELLPAKLGLWFKRDLPNPEFWTAVLALAFY